MLRDEVNLVSAEIKKGLKGNFVGVLALQSHQSDFGKRLIRLLADRLVILKDF